MQCGLDVGLLSPRQVRRDERGKTCFPHFEEDEVCGWEEVGQGDTCVATDGQQGLALARLVK